MQNTQTAIDLDELNVEIATKVMGWVGVYSLDKKWYGYAPCEPRKVAGSKLGETVTVSTSPYASELPAYSTEIAVAFQVIEKLKEQSKYEIVIWARCNIVQVMDLETEEYLADCSDESLPLAICRASLLALAATK